MSPKQVFLPWINLKQRTIKNVLCFIAHSNGLTYIEIKLLQPCVYNAKFTSEALGIQDNLNSNKLKHFENIFEHCWHCTKLFLCLHDYKSLHKITAAVSYQIYFNCRFMWWIGSLWIRIRVLNITFLVLVRGNREISLYFELRQSSYILNEKTYWHVTSA